MKTITLTKEMIVKNPLERAVDAARFIGGEIVRTIDQAAVLTGRVVRAFLAWFFVSLGVVGAVSAYQFARANYLQQQGWVPLLPTYGEFMPPEQAQDVAMRQSFEQAHRDLKKGKY